LQGGARIAESFIYDNVYGVNVIIAIAAAAEQKGRSNKERRQESRSGHLGRNCPSVAAFPDKTNLGGYGEGLYINYNGVMSTLST